MIELKNKAPEIIAVDPNSKEEIILKTHKILKQNGIEVMTIIIPRHIIRSEEIYKIFTFQ